MESSRAAAYSCDPHSSIRVCVVSCQNGFGKNLSSLADRNTRIRVEQRAKLVFQMFGSNGQARDGQVAQQRIERNLRFQGVAHAFAESNVHLGVPHGLHFAYVNLS